MEFSRSGIILNVENFDACVAFYRELFGLEVMFHQQYGDFRLTCLDLDGGYLMIETGGRARAEGKTPHDCPHKLRFNVDDIEQALTSLQARGIDAEIERNEWGDTIHLRDPDGNRVGIRDEKKFKRQIELPNKFT